MQNFKLNAMKIKKEQFSDRMKAIVLLLALACVNGYAQENNSSKGEDGSTSKEEGNRNVMLNAASANGPREIQIGLPSADVNVLENGIPVTYATNPHSVNSRRCQLESCGLAEDFRNCHYYRKHRLCSQFFYSTWRKRLSWYLEL